MENEAKRQAEAKMADIKALVASKDIDAILESALSVEVRNYWCVVGSEHADTRPAEFRILLCVGGPAVRIVGKLNTKIEPEYAAIEYLGSDGWRRLAVTLDELEILDEYCAFFYFGE